MSSTRTATEPTTPLGHAVTTTRANRRRRRNGKPLLGLLAWLLGIIAVIPILWMILTSLHKENDAAQSPPAIAAQLTLDGYRTFFNGHPWPALINSATASVVSTILVLALAIPAAYALAIKPVQNWRGVLFFMLSTKFLPLVGAILSLYLFALKSGLLDNIWLLIILYSAMIFRSPYG